jgi:hypothetical protein
MGLGGGSGITAGIGVRGGTRRFGFEKKTSSRTLKRFLEL